MFINLKLKPRCKCNFNIEGDILENQNYNCVEVIRDDERGIEPGLLLYPDILTLYDSELNILRLAPNMTEIKVKKEDVEKILKLVENINNIKEEN